MIWSNGVPVLGNLAHMRAPLRLLLMSSLIACGGPNTARPETDPEPATAAPTPPPTEADQSVTLIAPPSTIEEVRAQISAIVLLRRRAQPDGATGDCFVVDGVAWSRDLAFIPDQCVDVVDFEYSQDGARRWALLEAVHGASGTRLRHIGNFGNCRRSGECPPPSDDEIVQITSCARLSGVWDTVPDAHRTCAADTDCDVYVAAANCLRVPLTTTAMDVYRRYDQAHGVPCRFAAMGMCDGHAQPAVCSDGLCALSGP